jgi:SAM-dependent methyltransferase
MALYNLVTFKQTLLQGLQVDPAIERLIILRDRLAGIKSQVPVLDQKYAEYIDSLVDHYTQLIDQAYAPMEQLPQHIASIDAEIRELTLRLFAGNYELEERYGDVDSVRTNRRIHISEELEQLIRQRIQLYTNWQYPSLEIGCRDGEWTQHLIAADPLYIMDRHREFINSTANKFTPEYRNRLRQYHLSDHNLTALPKNQMAFAFSWGYFNYVSFETIKQYLRQVFEVLRPGGVFMFSYNDGDTPAGAGMAENFAQTYLPKSLLIPLCESLGYEVVNDQSFSTNIFWLEIKKPGTLSTIKAHQVLGEIKLREDSITALTNLLPSSTITDTQENS